MQGTVVWREVIVVGAPIKTLKIFTSQLGVL